MKKTPLLIVAILCMMMVSGSVFAADANYSDMPDKDEWNYAALVNALDNDLLQGFGDNTIKPNAPMDRAQMAAIMCRVFSAPVGDNAVLNGFTDIDKTAWYYTSEKRELAKAVEMKLFEGDENKALHPIDTTSREESFMAIARAFKVAPLSDAETKTVLAPFADKDKVAQWAAPTTAALVKAGYIQGSKVGENRYIAPQDGLNRSEFATMVKNIVAVFVDNQGEVPTKDVNGNVVVRAGNVHFDGIKITGDLILGEGVGDGNVVLDGTTVAGRTIARDGEVGAPVKTAKIANAAKHEAPEVGDVLTASYVPTDAVGPISYKWEYQQGKDWKAIDKATEATYTVTKDVLGNKLRVVIGGAQNYTATSDATKAVVIVAKNIVGVEKAVWSNTATPNAENVNKFMALLWAKDSVFSAEGTTLTVHSDKITKEMLTFIDTNWGGSSVPVALTFDGTVVNGLTADANWSKSVLNWIDLKGIVYNDKVNVKLADGAFAFDVDYVGGYASYLISLAQPKWSADTVNAKDVNALMAQLWDAKTGIFSVKDATLTLNIANITEDMKTKIKTYWGGASVPVKMIINGDKMKAGAADVNWDNSFVDWINLDDAVMQGTVERVLPNNKNFKYTVSYVNGKEYTKYFDTLAKPVWSEDKTPNAADVNKLMAQLWEGDKAVFVANGTKLTINCDNIDADVLLKIKTYWGGSSVPVKLVFDADNAIAKGLDKDANWSNSYLDWINLADAKGNSTVNRAIPNSADAYSYTVQCVSK
ncbi:MAG: S-layer homology domain-containing protein [Clostridiales bacterium]